MMKANTKKVVSLMVAIVMMLTLLIPTFGKSNFIDVEGNWAAERILKWEARGILPDSEKFYPNAEITRAEFVSIVNKLFGFVSIDKTQFSDVSAGSWYTEDFLIAKAAGYYKGFEGNKAMPEATISRQDAATLLARLFELKTVNTDLKQFKDAKDVSSYAAGAVVALIKAGAINGKTADTFVPKNPITKAEVVKIIDQLVIGYYNTPGTYKNEQIAGNVIVNAAGVVLKNTTIEGNLYITKGIGEGTVTLSNVTVKGKTFINGVEESVVIANCQLGTIVDLASEKNSQLLDLKVPVTIGGGEGLTTAFDPAVKEYTINVANDVSMVQLTATAAAYLSQITLNGKPVESGVPNMVFLVQGANVMNVDVIAKDGSLTSYKVTINREDFTAVINSFLTFTYTDKETGVTMPYRLYVPEGYDPKSATVYPIVLFLHGSGERGGDNAKQLTANMGATVWATPEVQQNHKAFVLAPQARNVWDGGFGITRNEANVLNLDKAFELSQDAMMAKKILDEVIATYKIDSTRVYCTGLSQGGIGTWNLNLQYPDLFAAMVPVCGGGNPLHENVAKLVNKPIWAFHAASDPVVPVTFSQNIVNALTTLKGTPKLTIYPADSYFFPVAHFAWIPAYHTDEMIEWLFEQKLTK